MSGHRGRRHWLAVPAAAVLVVLAACGDDAGNGPGTTPQPPLRPMGPDEVVVQVTVADPAEPLDAPLRTVPVTTALGDGTVISPAPVIAIFPGPAITPLQAGTASAAAVDSLVRRAEELGLLDADLEFGDPPVTDAPRTAVTIAARGRVVTHVALALDRVQDPRPGVDERAAGNRRALAEVVRAAQDLVVGDRAFVPDAVAATVVGPASTDPDHPREPAPWPIEALPDRPDPAGAGPAPCMLVTGDEAAELLEALGEADELTPWRIDGQAYEVAFRPVVPGAPTCPE